jgi:predicted TIM-barrel fold metal-dependent hydrolase
MPLLIHTGVIPHYQPWPISEHHPFRIDALANKYPGIPIILAHGGGRPFCREVLAVMQSNENTYLDLTHVLDKKYAWHIPLDDLQAFFDQIGPERIIYGTDYPWYRADDLARDLTLLKNLGVDRGALDMLMGGTFLKLLPERAN